MNTLRSRVMAAIAGLLALLVLALWLLRAGPLPPERAVNPPPPALAVPAASLPVAPAPVPAPASDAAPPWSAPPLSPPVTPRSGGAPAALTAAQAKSAALQSIQRQLTELVASGQSADPKKIDELLGEVERVQGSSSMGGVRIDVLRQNLALAAQMQALAADIQQIAGHGAQADPAQLQAKMARLVELQAQMRTDVLAAPVAAPAAVGQ